MVTLTAENVQDLMEAFFATYYADDIIRTGGVEVSSPTIEVGRKGFLSALRRLPESMSVNARGTVKQIINELAGTSDKPRRSVQYHLLKLSLEDIGKLVDEHFGVSGHKVAAWGDKSVHVISSLPQPEGVGYRVQDGLSGEITETNIGRDGKPVKEEPIRTEKAEPGPRMAEGFTGSVNPIDDEFLHNIIKVFLFGVPRQIPNYVGPVDELLEGGDIMPGGERVRNRAGNLSVEWSRIIALRTSIREVFIHASEKGKWDFADAIREIVPIDILALATSHCHRENTPDSGMILGAMKMLEHFAGITTDESLTLYKRIDRCGKEMAMIVEALARLDETAGDTSNNLIFSPLTRIQGHTEWFKKHFKPNAFTLPETIMVCDTDSVKKSVNVAALETNPVTIMGQLTQIEHVELVRALVKMLREAAGKPVNSIAPQDDGLVTKEAVSVGPPGGFFDSTKYNGYAYLAPKDAINPRFTYQIKR